MIDLYNRTINYARISITDVCNLRCKYCMPNGYVPKNDTISNDDFITIIKALSELSVTKIRLTGGEPLINDNILELTKRISEIEKIDDLCITTNGINLEKYARKLKENGVTKLNISIDTLNDEKFHDFTGGELSSVISGIKLAIELDFKVKLNIVLINGLNDDEIMSFCNLTKDLPIDVRFIELMPLGENIDFSREHYLPLSKVLDVMPSLYEIETFDKNGPATYYKLPEAKGNVGLISPISNKFCASCNRIRLTSSGVLKLCLHSDIEVDLKKVIDNNESVLDAIKKAIDKKPKEHLLDDNIYTKRSMTEIGG